MYLGAGNIRTIHGTVVQILSGTVICFTVSTDKMTKFVLSFVFYGSLILFNIGLIVLVGVTGYFIIIFIV